MKRLLLAAVVTATAGLLVLTGFASASGQQVQIVYIGMDTPLTGPTAIVGQGDREAVQARQVLEHGRRHQGRRLLVDILDNASNPSQAVQNVQRFVSDSKYVAILGSGNAGAAIATAPLATAGRIPFLALSPPTPLVTPARAVHLCRAADRAAVRVQHGAVPQEPRHHEDRADGRQRRLRARRSRPGEGARQRLRVHDHGRRDLLADVRRASRRAGQSAELERASALDVDGDSAPATRSSRSSGSSSSRSGSS